MTSFQRHLKEAYEAGRQQAINEQYHGEGLGGMNTTMPDREVVAPPGLPGGAGASPRPAGGFGPRPYSTSPDLYLPPSQGSYPDGNGGTVYPGQGVSPGVEGYDVYVDSNGNITHKPPRQYPGDIRRYGRNFDDGLPY